MNTGMNYFLVLVEEGSISAAARRLFVTQQAFSEQMKRLETAYGAVLFVRKPRFSLTPAGEALHAALCKISILEQGLEAQLREIRMKGIGHLRMGIHSTRARVLLPRVLERFRAKYPLVELTFFHDDTRGLETRLLRGELDLFFGVDTQPHPEFSMIELAKESIQLVASPKLLCRQLACSETQLPQTLSPSQLKGLDLIFSPPQSNLQAKINAFFYQYQITPHAVVTVSDFSIQLQLASRQVGACFCPQMLLFRPEGLPSENRQLVSLVVQGLDKPSQLSLVIHRHTYCSEYLRFLLDLLQDEFLSIEQRWAKHTAI